MTIMSVDHKQCGLYGELQQVKSLYGVNMPYGYAVRLAEYHGLRLQDYLELSHGAEEARYISAYRSRINTGELFKWLISLRHWL